MKRSLKKFLAVSGVAVMMLGIVGFSGVASAKSTKAVTKTVKVKTVKAPKGHKRTLPGKVVSVTGTTIMMKKGNTTYTIESARAGSIVNRKGTGIAITDIKAGHQISVRGTLTGTVMSNILKIRDITLPISTTK